MTKVNNALFHFQFEENRIHQKKQPPILSAYDVHLYSKSSVENNLKHHEVGLTTDKSETVEEGPPIWVTMGKKNLNTAYISSNYSLLLFKIFLAVCWSENSHYHGKDNFPYVASVPLSTQLWLKTTDAKVVIQIVYSEAEASEKLQRYKEELESYGALVKLVETKDVKCVLKSQIIRVLAFLLPEVRLQVLINVNNIVGSSTMKQNLQLILPVFKAIFFLSFTLLRKIHFSLFENCKNLFRL